MSFCGAEKRDAPRRQGGRGRGWELAEEKEGDNYKNLHPRYAYGYRDIRPCPLSPEGDNKIRKGNG